MATKEFEVAYKVSKEKKEGTIKIPLNRYQQSYADDLFHLGDYPQSIVDNTIYPDKLEFVQDAFKRQFGDDASITKSEMKKLIKSIDESVHNESEEE